MNRSPHPRLPLRHPLSLALTLALAPALAFGAPPLPGDTLPTGFNRVRGAVDTPVVNGNAMTIHQSSKGAIIDWGGFSIGRDASVTFQQPGADSVTLNRVTGNDLSQIAGSLTANGRIFLTNPNGVLFGAGASVNVGGLVASTLGVADNDDFMRRVADGSGFAFTAGGATSAGVDNAGRITAAHGGGIALLSQGPVANSGTLRADGGSVAMGVGREISLDIGGDGLTRLVIKQGSWLAPGADGSPATAIANSGSVQADGGRVELRAATGGGSATIAQSGLVRARSLQNRNGHIVLAGDAGTTVIAGGRIDADAAQAGAGGGRIDVSGRNILLDHDAVLSANGSRGGSVHVDADRAVAMAGDARVEADATTGNGSGGAITLYGHQTLRAHGTLSARGAGTGSGGAIETSGGGLDTRGIAVDVGGGAHAGSWLLDPYNVTILPGPANGSLPTNPFEPVGASLIYDGDINNALNGNADVTITTGTAGTAVGFIRLGDTAGPVNIERTSPGPAVTFTLQANAWIDTGANGGFIGSTGNGGPLNVVFNSNANGAMADSGYISLSALTVATQGGNVLLSGGTDPATGFASGGGSNFYSGVRLSQVNIDTRRGDGNDGSVVMRGETTTNLGYGGNAGAYLLGVDIATGNGDIDVTGRGNDDNYGVLLADEPTTGTDSSLATTGGDIRLTGFSDGQQFGNGVDAVLIDGADLVSGSGNIDVRGRLDDATTPNNADEAIHLGNPGAQADVITSTSGDVLLSGWSNSGASIYIARVNAGSGNIILRAHNDSGNPTLGVVEGSRLATSGVINVRPGGIDTDGALIETPDDPIHIGNEVAGSLSFPTNDLQIAADTLVIGSNVQAGDISVDAPNVYGTSLSLVTDSGDITLLGAVDVGAGTLALVSASGAITQLDGGIITAQSLLARSGSGDVLLDNDANQVAADTVAGGGGNFTFHNGGDVGIGNVAATGFDAGTDTPLALAASGIAASAAVFVRSVNGNLLLNAPVAGASADLVAGPTGLFLNPGANTIQATDWRVWTSTWVGENRGGVAGSGTLPNLYGCSYGTTCTSGITIPATGHHFVYVARPTANVDLGNVTREYGLPDTDIAYTVGGLVFADDLPANIVTGTLTTPATQASNVGNYPVNGTFTSPAGYLVTVTPGTLAITPATLTYLADPFSRMYGDPNGILGGAVTGFRNGDTLATATTGTPGFSSPADTGSNVGQYAINGAGLAAQNYVFVQAAGNATALTITPAPLTYIADPRTRYVGTQDDGFTGTLAGFRNGDTLDTATEGTLQFDSPAGFDSPMGQYGIFGSGLSALNYTFVQADGNAVALTILPPVQSYTLDVVRDTPTTYVYDRNFGPMPVCPALDLLGDTRSQDGDNLAREWSRVRSRPNLSNCVSPKRENGCSSF